MKTMLCAVAFAASFIPTLVAAGDGSQLLSVDFNKLVSRADLDYGKPASRSEEGMPVGNGRMGSLIWTTPTQLKFQINHVNVYGIDGTSNSFPERHTDYASNCGYLDINLVDFGDDVFAGNDFQQHLSLYDGVMTAKGRGVTVRVLGWPAHDVMAVEITDSREKPSPISIDLRMLQYEIEYHSGENWELTANHQIKTRHASHTTTSGLDIRDGRIALTQQFREGDFYGASAVVVGVLGRESQARYQNDAVVRLTVAPGRGKFTILIGAAASFDEKADIAGLALKEVDAAAAKGYDAIAAETAQWWHDFWARGFVHLHSADGQADFVEQQYTYFLYLMGSSSHGGDYPPRFGGMIWYTNGNMRAWGSEHWWANTSAYYRNLMPSGRLELMDPLYSMYSKMYDAAARAAQQQWGSQGIWIPETVWFNGPENLPDDIAAEMRDLYLMRKPWSEASKKFLDWAETKQPHYSRVNWKSGGQWQDGRFAYVDKGHPPFGHTSHILGVASRVADSYWQRYQFTMDEQWLRDRAYPMIKGAAEFYRNFPNFYKDPDGKYHIHHVNNGESNWDTPDSPYEVQCMNMIFPLAIRASEILGVDEDLRAKWQEVKSNLVAAPNLQAVGQRPARVPGLQGQAAQGQPQGQAQGGQRRRGFGAFVYNGDGAIEPLGSEPELKSRFLNFTMLGSFVDFKGSGGAQIFRNHLRLREGPGATDAEHIGGLTSGIHTCLLDSAPPSEEGEPVLKVFSTWPKDWDAEFTLLGRGAFLVSAAQKGGQTEFVEIRSRAGSPCRLQNPWSEGEVTLYRDGKKAENLSGGLLTFNTGKNEHVVVVRAGTTPDQFQRAVLKESAE